MARDTQEPSVAEADGPVPAGVALSGVEPTLPAGLVMSSDHRYWFNGEGPKPSVTTILGVADKPAVMTWKAKESARAMMALMQSPRLNGLSDDELILQAVREADKQRDRAATIGTSVHLLADMASRGQESDSNGFQVDSGTQLYLEAFRGFLGRYSASSIISSEKAVWSLNGYAGTYDLLMYMDCWDCQQRPEYVPGEWDCSTRELWLLDIKTSKGVYSETGLQLAAYRWADYIILPNDPWGYQMPKIDRTGVIHLRPEQYQKGWKLYEYQTTYNDDYLAFLGLLEFWKWRDAKRFSRSELNGK